MDGEAKPTTEQATANVENVQRESLNDKFPLQTQEFPNGTIAFRDIKPENPRDGDAPIVMMTGFAMNQEVVGNTSKAIYEKDHEVIPLDIVGGGKGVKGPEGSSPQINRQAELLKKWIESRGEEKFKFVGQSLSAITLLAMLENHPEVYDKVDSVLLVSPMGLGGKDSLLGLGKRQLAEIRRDGKVQKNEERQEINKRVGKAFTEFMTHHPIRAWQEVKAMSQADEYDVLYALQEAGIKVGIVQGDLDQLNSSERVWNKIGESSESPWKTLSQEDYEKDKDEYDKRGIKPGQTVFDRESNPATPPFESITMTSGGHEIFGPEAMGGKILRAFEYIDHPESFRSELSRNLNQEAETAKAEIDTAVEIADIREEIKNEQNIQDNSS